MTALGFSFSYLQSGSSDGPHPHRAAVIDGGREVLRTDESRAVISRLNGTS